MIDAHTHLTHGHHLDPGLIEEGERLGVTRFLCANIADYRHYPSIDDIIESNAAMAEISRQHPGRIDGYCYLNPRHGRAAHDELRRRVEDDGMIGIKLWVATTCDDPLVYPIAEMAVEYRIPMLIHSWRKTVGQLPYETSAANVAHLAARYPELKIVMAHLGGQVESAMSTIEPHPNIHPDTSGSPIGGAEVAIAVQRLGARRVVFGSDLHGADLASNVGKVVGAHLSPDDFELVMGANMERILSEAVR
jgi:predicted TIM-barrel fold metal-dependent hydrolase